MLANKPLYIKIRRSCNCVKKEEGGNFTHCDPLHRYGLILNALNKFITF